MPVFTRAHTKKSKKVFEGEIISLRLDELKTEDGHETTREVVEHNGGVTIACQPTNDEILLIRQYRYSIDEDLIELPAGRIEAGEDPLPAAQRELIEETGFRAERWTELSRMYTAPGFCNEILYMYRATELTEVGKNLDFDEETDVMRLTLKEAWQLVLDGKIRDAKTIAGLGMLSEMHHAGQLL